MTTEWKNLTTLQEVAAAQAAGEEIEYLADAGNYKYEKFRPWDGGNWLNTYEYRSRPKPRTKKVVLRKAVFKRNDSYWTGWYSDEELFGNGFVCWLDAPAKEIEVPE